MKKLLSLLFVLFVSVYAFSQKTISGVVKDADGPVASASVTVEEPGKDAIIAYTISNDKGEYKITFTSAESNVEVKVKAFNHKTMVAAVSNETQTKNFTVESEATEIKEVKIKTKLITKKGDTITYDLKAFESKADRTVADVLRKIPGIEVNFDGTILYQGEGINKFYVNGKDLMEGGYGVINNSLPKDAVQKVEVLENHQPVKILQDKVPSEKAALNIVLKNKMTMTGRGEVGAGFADVFLWNLKLTPMFFGQKNQWVVNYKTNNVGETVEDEGNILAFGDQWEGRRVQAGQNDWLNVENANVPPLPEKRYLMNNVHYFSANMLTTPFKNKEWELKVNANYTNNSVTREDYAEIHDLEFNQTYITTFRNRFYTDKAKGELVFTKNAKKGFFKNVTTFSQFWNTDRAWANRNDEIYGSRSGFESVESPTTNFQNSLSTIIPWKEKMVNFTSYLHYQTDKQTLEISPQRYLHIPVKDSTEFDFGAVDRVRQDFNMKTFEAMHSAKLSFVKNGWTFTPEVGLNHQTNSMNSLLEGLGTSGNRTYGNLFENDITYTNTLPYASVGISFKSDAWSLYSNIPFNFNHISVEDRIRSGSKNLNKFTVEPNIYLLYSFASFWKASLNGNINYSFGDINDVYAGYILTNPNSFSFMTMDNPIVETNLKSAGTRIEYRNPMSNLFFNVGYRMNWNTRNLTTNILTRGTGTSALEYLVRDFNTESSGVSAELGKYFPGFKTNVSVGYNNNTNRSEQMRNSTVQDISGNSQNLNFKFNNTYFEWLSFDYNMSAGWSRNKMGDIRLSQAKRYNHNLATYIYPMDNHIIGFFWDQINSSSGARKYRNGFYDLSYQYTWAKKKIDFELKWLNIANRKLYEDYNIGTITEEYSRIQLRPSHLMFTVKFNFK